MRRVLLHIVTILAVAVAVCSCRTKLHDPVSDAYFLLNVDIRPNIVINENSDIWNNTLLKEKVMGKMPSAIRLCFYDPDGHYLVAEEVLPPEGGFVNIEPGVYDIIMYGLGTEVSRVENKETRGGAMVATNGMGQSIKAPSKSGDTKAVEDYKVFFEPDHLYAATLEEVEIPRHSEAQHAVEISADLLTTLETFSFKINNVEGIERIAKVDLYITGQAPQRFLWNGRFPENRTCALKYEAFVNVEESCIYTIFNTYGRIPGQAAYAYVLITTVSGHQFQWLYEVTEQMANPDNYGHAIVVNEVIEVPETEGGFGEEVVPWDEEIIDIPL